MAKLPESIYIAVAGTESSHTLLEFSRLLYHLDLVYEISRLATDDRYRRYKFPQHTFRRFVSPLQPGDQMILSKLRHESPWELSVLLRDPWAIFTGGLGAIWLFVQCLERLSTLRLNRRKLRAEIQKLELEASKLRNESVTIETKRLSPGPSKGEIGPGMKSDKEDAPFHEATSKDSDSLIPPDECMRLYRRLKHRGADRFYESNISAIQRLGFEVNDFEIGTDGTTEE